MSPSTLWVSGVMFSSPIHLWFIHLFLWVFFIACLLLLGCELQVGRDICFVHYYIPNAWSFPIGTSGKESTCQCRRCETWVQSLSQEDALEQEVTTSLVFLSGKFFGQRSMVSCCPWGHKESDTTEHISQIPRELCLAQNMSIPTRSSKEP